MATKSRGISPHVASWLGTFVAAGIQLAVNSKGEKNAKRATRLLQNGLRMSVLGPLIGLALWKIFNKAGSKSSVLPVLAASLIGTSLLKTEEEVESVNSIIWLRIASNLLAGLPRRSIDVLTHVAITATFYGVVCHTSIAPGMLVKMTRRFLTPPVFDAVRKDDADDGKNVTRIQLGMNDACATFVRTFKGLFAYNYFLHFAAALVAYLIRNFGSRVVKGTRKFNATLPSVLLQAVKEATVLNTAVSASCALLVGGSVVSGPLLGVALVPAPLHFCAPRVRDTVYFLFLPWCVKYLFRLHNLSESFNPRVRLLMGVYSLEGPLRSFSNDHEGYSWMIGVAFGLVKNAGSGLL